MNVIKDYALTSMLIQERIFKGADRLRIRVHEGMVYRQFDNAQQEASWQRSDVKCADFVLFHWGQMTDVDIVEAIRHSSPPLSVDWRNMSDAEIAEAVQEHPQHARLESMRRWQGQKYARLEPVLSQAVHALQKAPHLQLHSPTPWYMLQHMPCNLPEGCLPVTWRPGGNIHAVISHLRYGSMTAGKPLCGKHAKTCCMVAHV